MLKAEASGDKRVPSLFKYSFILSQGTKGQDRRPLRSCSGSGSGSGSGSFTLPTNTAVRKPQKRQRQDRGSYPLRFWNLRNQNPVKSWVTQRFTSAVPQQLSGSAHLLLPAKYFEPAIKQTRMDHSWQQMGHMSIDGALAGRWCCTHTHRFNF